MNLREAREIFAREYLFGQTGLAAILRAPSARQMGSGGCRNSALFQALQTRGVYQTQVYKLPCLYFADEPAVLEHAESGKLDFEGGKIIQSCHWCPLNRGREGSGFVTTYPGSGLNVAEYRCLPSHWKGLK